MQLQNLFGALGLDSTLLKIANYLEQIASTMGRTYPDTSGRMQVNVITGALTSVTTLTSQTQQSGYSTAYDQYAQMYSCAQGVRSKITTS